MSDHVQRNGVGVIFSSALILTAVLTLALAAPALGDDPLMPDPQMTPGAWNDPPTPLETLCMPGYTTTVRHVSNGLKIMVFREYGYDLGIIVRGDYEIDHLVSLELDGSNDIKNLWPESYRTSPLNARRKDVLENTLKRLVCAHQLALSDAQIAIATDWPAAYGMYVITRR